ncbi:hypothetical protein BG006_010455 [Podila minutissima]|uniref:Uncharacterized protein n=1 Tax=Podila minutissima TaxID=64525 RepID=A0A9P5SD22_9FUNG|nr:hypothetical protein BG006_010455 [Podila minutissima]
MNSKETSIPIELLAQKWDEDGTAHESADDSRSSKRRRKTESTSDDDDEGDFHSSTHSQDEDDNYHHTVNNNNNHHHHHHHHHHNNNNTENRDDGDKHNYDHGHENDKAPYHKSSSPPHSSKKSSASNGTRTYKHRKSTSKANNNTDRHTPSSNSGLEQDDASRYQNHISGSKNGRSTEEDTDAHSVVPSTKRRKTAKPDSLPRDDSLPPEDGEYTGSSTKKDASGERSESRSKKNGTTSRSSKRQSGSDHDNDDSNTLDTSFHPTSTRSSSHTQSPAVVSKKSFSRRHHKGSRHSTPVPRGDGEGTPQPMAPVQPAAVRYPSAKMTLQDMTKRAKQLLDYIARVQVDMADRKNKLSPHSTPPKGASKVVPEKDGQTPTPTKDSVHGDNQVCPNSARSSIDGTMDGPSDLKSLDSKGEEMGSLALTELDSKLLSTSSVTLLTQECKKPRTMDVFPLSGALHIPAMPSSPLEGGDDNSVVPMNGTSDSVASSEPTETKAKELTPEKALTSLEMMDKLSGDLIRFQERFGADG